MIKSIRFVPLRDGQLQKYLDFAKRERVYPVFYVGLQSDLRQSELLTLSWAAVDLSEHLICGQYRTVELDEEAFRLLTQEKQIHPRSETVFIHPATGLPYQRHQFYYLHEKLCALARLPEVSYKELQLFYREVGQ